MSERISAEELAKLAELEKKATPGPWDANGNETFPARAIWNTDGDVTKYPEGFVEILICESTDKFEANAPSPQRESNLHLIAALRNAAPSILTELEQLRRENEAIKTKCKVVYWPSLRDYPIEHNARLGKDQWSVLIAAALAGETEEKP